MNVHFSSKTEEWETPQAFFEEIQAEFNLEIDVCATHENHKLSKFWTKTFDGLSTDWQGIRGWMNPPYGRTIGKWVEKAATGGGKHCCGFTSCTN